jgi:enterochelin esterase-like enzyme
VTTGAVRPFVLVGIPNSPARFDEYTHVKDTLPGYGTTGGRADEYASFVTTGILPFVRARYALRPESSQTALLGSSLGGLVSLYIGLKNRSSFGYAGAMSGTMSWGSIGVPNTGKNTLRELYMAAPPRGLSIYLDSGGDDGGGCGTLSALDSELYHDQYCETSQMRDTLTSLGWVSGRDLVYAWTPRAAHDERAWASRLPALFRNWFPGR